MQHFIQEINYSQNPDFKNQKQGNSYFTQVDEIKIKELVDYLDAQIEYLTSNNIQDASDKFIKATEFKINELRELLNSRSLKDKELNEVLATVLNATIEYVKIYLDHTNKNSKKSFSALDKQDEAQLAKLKDEGFLEFQIPHTKEFLSICNASMEYFKKKYEGQDDWRGANSLDKNSSEFKFLQKFIIDNKIIELISAYKNMHMEIYYIAIDYSHHRQKWFRNNHTFNKLVPTNYYHYDADANIAKMLIYLSDVSNEDGPFKFVQGSNRLSRSIFLNYIFYSIDSKISPLFFNKENLYGRGLFLYRKDLLMKFPQMFMGSTHFGDDLLESTALSKYLVEKTVTFTRDRGAAVLFDGFRGIHSGGNASKGERLAVQVAFKKIEEKISSISRLKRFVKKLLRSKQLI